MPNQTIVLAVALLAVSIALAASAAVAAPVESQFETNCNQVSGGASPIALRTDRSPRRRSLIQMQSASC